MTNDELKEEVPLPYESRQVANRLIEVANQSGFQMSIMRLLKLTYMAHGWSLAMFDKPLVNDYVEAWKYGPVISIIYYGFRPYGVYNLKKVPFVHEQSIGDKVNGFLESVHELYGDLSDRQLTQLTHIRGGPWRTVYEPGKMNIFIPNQLISEHFKSKIERSKSQTAV